jgi:hypothetical protein
LVGVTGTNGKTTIASLLYQLYKKAERRWEKKNWRGHRSRKKCCKRKAKVTWKNI